eukprot:PLAT11064.1.p1 GENE.PLAT11064.1~~PLAT11064.1.p1  ORF type:complete len:530 (-),score=255.05 PLAT11064.1:259-1848(-)
MSGYDPMADESSGPVGVELHHRPRRDACWSVVYALVMLAGIAFSLIALSSNPTGRIQEIQKDQVLCNIRMYNSSLNGGLPTPEALMATNGTADAEAALVMLVPKVLLTVLIVAGFSLAIGVVWMYFLYKHPKFCVYATVALKVVVLTLLGIVLLVLAPVAGVIVLIFAGLVLGLLCCWRARLRLSAALLKEAMAAFGANWSMFCWGIALITVLMVLGTFAFAGILYSYFAGMFVTPYNSPVSSGVAPCSIDVAPMNKGMILVIAIWIGWTAQFFHQVRMYTIGAATGIWYFHEDDPAAPRNRVRTGLKWALTSSLGTNLYAALVIYVLKSIRHMLRRQRGVLALIARVIMCCLQAIFKFINGFLVVFAAITGENFCNSLKNTFQMLQRNWLNALVVDVVLSRVLGLGAFIFSLAGGFLGYYIMFSMAKPLVSAPLTVISAVVAAVLSFIMALIILFYYAGLALNFVDAVFVCYAVDKDCGRPIPTGREGVHTTFVELHVDESGKRVGASALKGGASGAPAGAPPMAKAV